MVSLLQGEGRTVRVLKPKLELERVIEARCLRHAKRLGWTSRKMNGLGFRAWPDRLLIPPRRSRLPVLWIEFKRVGEHPTPLQRKLHKDLRARGQRVHVIDNLQEFVRVLARSR